MNADVVGNREARMVLSVSIIAREEYCRDSSTMEWLQRKNHLQELFPVL